MMSQKLFVGFFAFLLLLSGGAILADDHDLDTLDDDDGRVTLHGHVVAVDAASSQITMHVSFSNERGQDLKGTDITVHTDENTGFKKNGHDQDKAGTIEGVTPGNVLKVKGALQEDGSVLASRVQVRTELFTLKGTVVSSGAETIRVTIESGSKLVHDLLDQEHDVVVNSDTVFKNVADASELTVGMRVGIKGVFEDALLVATRVHKETPEANEGEGEGTETTDKSDLTVLDIYDDTGKLSVSIGNVGVASVPGDTGHLYIWIDDQLEWTYSLSTLSSQSFLSPGGTTVVQPQVLSGQHTIKAFIDPENAIAESDENNNILEKTLTF